ncbi:RNA methyltransferase [uncultured Dialister sp.]|jgi:TrmH family RNA methyltransferase|uniref:TrmH family RNA methyltransferase n=1 Tax=uncultured Dialister sp. TaxID=278064 RepID=UPI0025FB9D71|nr:RNA methyltransferase [uncultured Dialister sp.]
MERISSRNNQWIKKALQLKQKKWRDREGLFLLEGVRIVEDALNQGITGCTCFFTDEALSNPRVSALLEKAETLGWRLLSLEDPLMKVLSGTEHSQGIMLICPERKENPKDLLRPLSGFYVVLDTVQDPGNLGTILRTAAAAGVKGLILTEGCADAYSEKAARSSMGSLLRIPVYRNVGIDFLKEMKETSGLPFFGTALENGVPYKEVGPLKEGVFIFGNEGNGVRKDILSFTDKNLYIPLAGHVESLNVSIAAAVILFHFI